MSTDKLPSALSLSTPGGHQSTSPRGAGGSVLCSNPYSTKKEGSSPPQHLPSPSSSHNGHAQQYVQFAYGTEATGYMNTQNQSSYTGLDYHQHHLSQGQSASQQNATSAGGLASFPQPPLHQPTYQTNHAFPQFSFPPNGISSSTGQSGGPMGVHSGQQLLPLPQSAALNPSQSPLNAVTQGGPQTSQAATAGSYGNHSFDATGQIAPPGMKPRVAATLWEDEGSLCFQVEARGVCVARREDNHMINGTKLLNVAGMTRGRRDGILKSEKQRHVVKIGPMHLKGVWIPFERALDFANKEKITELLYPLFVHNIGAFLYHPTNTHRTHAVMAAAERRRNDSSVISQSQALNQVTIQRRASDIIPSSQPPALHHQSMHAPLHGSMPQHSNMSQTRPELQRSMSFPTPPSSASSVMGVSAADSQNFWGNTVVSSVGGNTNGSLAIDTVMNNARSMPTTPATTPPGGLQGLPQYSQQSNPMYPSSQSAMSHQNIAQQNMQRFNQPLPQPNQYMGHSRDPSTMGPPSSRVTAPSLSRPSSRQDLKDDGEEQNGLAGEVEDHTTHGEEEYTTHDGGYANGQRSNVYYPPLSTDHSAHLSPEMSGSPGHGQTPSTPARSTYVPQNVNVSRGVDTNGGATPRTTTTPQQWVQNGSGYSTPPRANSVSGASIRHPPSRNLYQLVTGDPAADHGDSNGSGAPEGGYAAQAGLGLTSQTSPQSYGGVHAAATSQSNKRMRELEDDDDGSRPSSRDQDDRTAEGDAAGLKRRKTMREGLTPSGGMGSNAFDRNSDGRINRPRSAVVPRRAAR